MDSDTCFDISTYTDKELRMHYKLCNTTLKHFEKILAENPVLGKEEQTAITVCLNEAQADVKEAEEEFKKRNINYESDSESDSE